MFSHPPTHPPTHPPLTINTLPYTNARKTLQTSLNILTNHTSLVMNRKKEVEKIQVDKGKGATLRGRFQDGAGPWGTGFYEKKMAATPPPVI